MVQLIARTLILFSLAVASPAVSAPRAISLTNQTGMALRELALRRVGDSAWAPLAIVSAGASARVTFDEKECAYDLRATIAGVGPVVWRGVNLCDVTRVTLHRDASGRVWVDYD